MLCQKKKQLNERAKMSVRQIAFHAGRRVRARRNGTHSGRRAWRPLAGAGHRNWSLRGPSGRSQVTASKTRQAANKTQSKARSRKGPRWSSQKALSKTLPRDKTRAQAREPSLSVKASVVETRKACCAATLCTVATGRREESSAHTKASPLRCSTTGGTQKILLGRSGSVKL